MKLLKLKRAGFKYLFIIILLLKFHLFCGRQNNRKGDIMENWKVIEEASNYEISDCGNVRNKTTKRILKGRITKNGYLQVSLKIDNIQKFQNRYIHRLVAIYWLGKKDCLEVNHKDGNKLNNNMNNLEWVTSAENQEHKRTILGKNKTSQRVIGQFSLTGEFIKKFDSILEAAASFGKTRVNIDNALQGKQKTAYGFIWRYLN